MPRRRCCRGPSASRPPCCRRPWPTFHPSPCPSPPSPTPPTTCSTSTRCWSPRNQCLGKLRVSLDEEAHHQGLAIEQEPKLLSGTKPVKMWGKWVKLSAAKERKGAMMLCQKTAPTPRGPKTKFNPLVVILLFIERPSSRG